MSNLNLTRTSHTVRVRSLLSLLALLVVALCAGLNVRAQADEKVSAVVNGRQITEREVDDSIIPQLLPLQRQMYELRKKALDNLIVKELLEAEAKKRGVSVEELRRQLTETKVEVSPAEVEKLYAENASLLSALSPDEARERLRLDLESQARMRSYREAISKLRESASVDIRLNEVMLPVEPGGDAFALGPKFAPVTVVEFSDFQCPYCRGAQPVLKRLIQVYGDKVRLVFKNLPLADIHPQAMPSALAAFCAGEQGVFWQYHDALFASGSDLSPDGLDGAASRVGLNLPRFKSCLDSEKARSAVLADVREANRLGISGTPTFLINGKLVSRATGFDDFRRLIDRELKSLPNASASR